MNDCRRIVHNKHLSEGWLAAQKESVKAHRDARQAAWLRRHRGSIGVTASEGKLHTRLMLSSGRPGLVSSGEGGNTGGRQTQMIHQHPEPVRVGTGDRRGELGFRDAAISLLLRINEAAHFHFRRSNPSLSHMKGVPSNFEGTDRWTKLRTDLLAALELHNDCHRKLLNLKKANKKVHDAGDVDVVERVTSSSNIETKKEEDEETASTDVTQLKHLLLDVTCLKRLAREIANNNLFMDE